MFFIPIGTDAPIYHWPFSTVAMIVLNTLVFIATFGMAPEQVEPFILQYGNGLNPLQWITANFIHGGIFHLVGNMVFLWAFGIVVEGKIGWWKFLTIYMGVGIVQCAIEQTLMLGATEGGSVGASSIIFGLLAICIVWAPMNEMTCAFIAILLYRAWVHTFELAIWVVGIIYLGIEIFFGVLAMALADDFALAMTSEVLHLIGAGVGLGVGVLLLQFRLVDCENWDMFSLWRGKHTPGDADPNEHLDELRALKPGWSKQEQSQPPEPVDVSPEATLGQIRNLIAMSQPTLALNLYQKLARESQGWHLPEADHVRLIDVLHEREMWLPSIDLMVEYLRTHQARQAYVRLKLAAVLVTHQQRPKQALHVLSKLRQTDLDRSQQQVFQSLSRKAQQMKPPAEFEPPAEDW